MRTALIVAVFGTVALAPSARAEFQIAPVAQEARTAAIAGAQPITFFSARSAPAAFAPVRRRRLAVPTVPLAQGFGHQVPLAFAAQQIVPAKVSVTFGPDVEQDALVDWSGGRSWVDALRAAVRPLGLRLSVTWKAVHIARA